MDGLLGSLDLSLSMKDLCADCASIQKRSRLALRGAGMDIESFHEPTTIRLPTSDSAAYNRSTSGEIFSSIRAVLDRKTAANFTDCLRRRGNFR